MPVADSRWHIAERALGPPRCHIVRPSDRCHQWATRTLAAHFIGSRTATPIVALGTPEEATKLVSWPSEEDYFHTQMRPNYHSSYSNWSLLWCLRIIKTCVSSMRTLHCMKSSLASLRFIWTVPSAFLLTRRGNHFMILIFIISLVFAS